MTHPRFALAVALSVAVVAIQASDPARLDVLTQHNDTDRSGWNPREAALTPANVTSATFGKLFDLRVDGLIYAQPLVVTGVDVAGPRDLVIVATQHNSVYAFDAATGEQMWFVNVGPSIPTPNRYWNTAWGPYLDLTQEVGITSTPVVDRETLTLYFASVTWRPSSVAEGPEERVWQNDPDGPIVNYHLHAVDVRTGIARVAPIVVEGSVPVAPSHAGRHDGPARLAFNPMQHLQRPALLLVKSRLVIAFGSHADQAPYQGWVFAYDVRNLGEPPWVWSTMAGGAITQMTGSGIWQAGMGLTADADGNVLLTTGNGPFDPSSGNYGDSVVKLSMRNGIAVADYFSPCNQSCLEASDGDLGASGVLRLPGTNLFLAGGKPGKLHLLDGANLGKSAPPPRPMCASPCSDPRVMACANPNVLQEFQAGCDVAGNPARLAPPTPCSPRPTLSHAPPGTCPPLMYQVVGHHIHGSPVYWKGARRGPVVYVWAENDVLRAFPFNARTKRFAVTGCTARPPSLAWTAGTQVSPAALHFGMTGGMLSISSSGGTNGIVWATTPTNNDANQRVVPGILRAYDATDLRRELWNSYQVRDRDDFGNFSKHAPPTIANGRVYVPTFSGHLSVYGLNPPPHTPIGTLVANGDFESGDGGWMMEGDGKFDDGFPYYGTGAAALCPSPDRGGRLWQALVAPDAGDYVLTAYIATNIRPGNIPPESDVDAVSVGVDVDGVLVRTSDRAIPYAGYQKRVVEFTAAKGSRIRVWLQAPPSVPLPFYGVTPAASQPPAFASIDGVTLARK